MCWMCDHPGATLDDYLDVLRDSIRRHGWAVQYIESKRRPFAYTIGLHEHGLAELMITGVEPARAVDVLNAAARYCTTTVQPQPGERLSLPDCVLEFVHVIRPEEYVKHAFDIYGPEVRALQIVWIDDRGHSPWCPDFDHGRGSQPVLGPRAVPRRRSTTRRKRRRR